MLCAENHWSEGNERKLHQKLAQKSIVFISKVLLSIRASVSDPGEDCPTVYIISSNQTLYSAQGKLSG